MATINKAFGYRVRFSKLYDIVKPIDELDIELNGDCNEQDYVIIVGARQNPCINGITLVVQAKFLLTECSFNSIENAYLMQQIDNCNYMLEFVQKFDRVSLNAVMQNERIDCPIMTGKNNIPYLQQLGIQPWQHLLFSGDKIYVYVWDTRNIEMVLSIEQTDGLSMRMLKPARDNNAPLHGDYELKPSVHPALHRTIGQELGL